MHLQPIDVPVTSQPISRLGRNLAVVLLATLLLTLGTLPAQAQTSDMQRYLQVIDRTKELSPDQQLRIFRQFLQDNPELRADIRSEVESNIQTLQSYINESDPQKKKEKQDADLYMKALSYSQRLTLTDQEALWDQFLSDNPKSLYAPEARTRLLDLRKRLGLNPDGTRVKVEQAPIKDAPITSRLNYKDPDKALLLGSLAGIFVPGMAHWYTEDYVIAGLLTALRVAAGIAAVSGYTSQTSSLYILGGILGGASYLGDVADATFSVDRYNQKLEAKSGLSLALSLKF